MKYQIIFDHEIIKTYVAYVDAESEEEAIEKFEDDPFNFTTEDTAEEQGIDIVMTSITEI